jgi:hypothetical protein
MYKLGQEITINSKLKRVTEFKKTGTYNFTKKYRKWELFELKKPIKVIVIGTRTLFDGWVEYDYEVGGIFQKATHFKALLVVSKLSEKPFYILP